MTSRTLGTLLVLLPVLCLQAPAQDSPPRLEKIATGFRFVEGPAWDPLEQHLLFSDIPNNRIMKLSAEGKISVYLEPSGKANGLAVDRGGDLYACLGGDRQVVRIDAEGKRAVVARMFGGKRLNSPNDLVLDDAGGLYFTDPRYGKAGDLEQDKMSVYYVAADGRIRRVIDDLGRPNGIVMAPDGSGLYVAAPDQRAIHFYPVLRPGHLGQGKRIFQGTEQDGNGPDGMTVDRTGQVYATYKDVLVLSGSGALRKRIPVPERPANVTIGGVDGKTLFITARTSLYRCQVEHPAATEYAESSWLKTRMIRPKFEPLILSEKVGIGYGVATGDVNGDGRVDVILVDRQEVAWFENPGNQTTWTKHSIVQKLTATDHVCLAVRDVDGDGMVEIAVGAGWNPADTEGSGKTFVLRAPADRRKPWKAVALPNMPTVHRMAWVRSGPKAFDLVVLPLHGVGNKNGKGKPVHCTIHRPPPGWPKAPQGAWQSWALNLGLHETHGFDPMQWDQDSAEELAFAGREGALVFDIVQRSAETDETAPPKNKGLLEARPLTPATKKSLWAERVTAIADQAVDGTRYRGTGEIRCGTTGSAERVFAAVEPLHGHQLVLYSPVFPGTPRTTWRRRVLGDDLVGGHALACGDLNGDGTPEIVVGWRGRGAGGAAAKRVGIRVYLPHSARGELASQVLVDDRIACEDLKLADLNGDGRLDIVAAGRSTHDLKIYFNRTDK